MAILLLHVLVAMFSYAGQVVSRTITGTNEGFFSDYSCVILLPSSIFRSNCSDRGLSPLWRVLESI